MFHGRLQYEMSLNNDENLANTYFYSKNGFLNNVNIVHQRDLKQKVLQSAHLGVGSSDNLSDAQRNTLKGADMKNREITKEGESYNQKCFIPANYTKRNFVALEQSVYLYSAYLDERYGQKMIRIMSVLALEKKDRTLEIFCHFNVNRTNTIKKAKLYELCENHGKKYGGFMWSCEVPPLLTDLCYVNVSLKIVPTNKNYRVPKTDTVTMAVTNLAAEQLKFDYSICVPPLFGDINTEKFIEFIELNRIFGIDHFIFYNFDITNKEVLKLLEMYSSQKLVTLIDWRLPSVIAKNQIWYNGQLSAHNDCMYRAMSLTKYLAIIDIDEYIVPHNNKRTLHESLGDLFNPKVCGLSFDSAFYDPKFRKYKQNQTEEKSGLVTVDVIGRSRVYSKVRTKVLVQPTKIFEVGIHHISKPAEEDYKVLKVNVSTAYLHHYRNCVPNYGMRCGDWDEDKTLVPLNKELQAAVDLIKSKLISEWL